MIFFTVVLNLFFWCQEKLFVYFLLCVVTSGIALAAGLFLPMMIVGKNNWDCKN